MDLDIEKLALLARIKITPSEKEEFKKEFEEILGYVSKLKEAPVQEAEADFIKTTDLENVMREDEDDPIPPSSNSEKLLKEAPAVEKGYVKVKHVFGNNG